MMEEIKELIPTGKLKRPSYETVANWVKDSWNAVDVNLIRRSFKCCGVSNNRDGSEDDWIFNYDHLGQTDRLNDGVEIRMKIVKEMKNLIIVMIMKGMKNLVMTIVKEMKNLVMTIVKGMKNLVITIVKGMKNLMMMIM